MSLAKRQRTKNELEMWTKERILEEIAGDLEYNPRRAAIYGVLAGISFLLWWRLHFGGRYSFLREVVGLGGLAFLVKAVFLFRRSSEGFDATPSDRVSTAKSQTPPLQPRTEGLRIAAIGQILQDFGAGSMLLWPFLALGSESTEPLFNLKLSVIATGAAIFAIGWTFRKV